MIEGTNYTNDYFGLSFKTPDGWTIANEETKQNLTNTGAQVVAGEDDKLNKQLDLSKKKTLNMVFAF